MDCSEPLTDFHARLYADDGPGIDVQFNVGNATSQLTADESVPTDTLRRWSATCTASSTAGRWRTSTTGSTSSRA